MAGQDSLAALFRYSRTRSGLRTRRHRDRQRRAKGAAPIAPLALEAVNRIDALFDIEREINGESAERRFAVCRERSAPLVTELEAWMRTERTRLSRHAPVAKAMDHMLKRWEGFTRFVNDGRICLTNNTAERASAGLLWQRRLFTEATVTYASGIEKQPV